MKTPSVDRNGVHFGLSRGGFCSSAIAMLAGAPLALLMKPRIASALPSKNELDVLRGMIPRQVQAWSGGVFPEADGATDANRSGYSQVGYQYHTFNLLSASLLNNDVRSLDAAIRVAEYAFAHQNADGSFQFVDPNNAAEARPSSATLFFYDFGHSLLLLAKDSWFTASATCAPYRERIAKLRSKSGLSLSWLMGQRALLATDRAASNRSLAHGLTFYFLGRALASADAVAAGRDIVNAALDAVHPDGTFPEAGGFDSSYQAVAFLECEWLYFYVDPTDDALRVRLWSAIERGYARESGSIMQSGEIGTLGNTRVSAHGEAVNGHAKSVNWKQISLAIAYYAAMADDSKARELGASVLSFYYPAKV